jgi:hypothetical protein
VVSGTVSFGGAFSLLKISLKENLINGKNIKPSRIFVPIPKI